MREFDLFVIGGGSAGLKAARTAAKMGRTVAVAEERELGGECFWAGCVPTKAMVRAAQVWHLVRHADRFGIHPDGIRADFADAMRYKDQAVRAVGGDGPADGGLSHIGAAYFPQQAAFEGPGEIRIGGAGGEVVRAKTVVLATGTVPWAPPVPGLKESGYITNREAVNLTSLPRRLLVIGAGPIGLEFAQVFCRFGAEVTVIERMDAALPREDADVSAVAAASLGSEGVRVLLSANVTEVMRLPDGTKRATLFYEGKTETADFDEILVAAGRHAATRGLNLDAAGVAHSGPFVQTDEYLRTTAPNVWAAGDVSGGYLFTHVASYEGKLVAENAFGDAPTPRDDRAVPRCTFIHPEVGSIGLTEREARAAHERVATYSFSFADLDRAVLHGEPHGLVKLVAEERTGLLLGAHIIGPEASSILAEVAVCFKHGLPVSAIADTMHAYPSFPEAVEAAALSAHTFRGQVDTEEEETVVRSQ